MVEPPLPPIEHHPPYSVDFVACLDAGCYPDSVTPDLLAAVNSDEEGRRVLVALALVGLQLRAAAPWP